MEKKKLARSASITHLQGLSSRALMALEKHGISTVGELADLHENDLYNIPNIGAKLAVAITCELGRFEIVDSDKSLETLLAQTRGWLGRVESRVDSDANRIKLLEERTISDNQRHNNLVSWLRALESAVNKLTGDATLKSARELVESRKDDAIEVSTGRELPKDIQDLLWMPESATNAVLNRKQVVKLRMYLEGQQDLIVWHEQEQIRLKESKGRVIENFRAQGDELNLLKETLRNLVRD